MSETDDYDNPWKEILDSYFESFLVFFFPAIHADIDWTRGYESLDAELRHITRDAHTGKRLADKLVKVWRLSGEETWVLIHIEIQSQSESGFAERVFVYFYRLRDRYPHPVVSLVLLGDEEATWRPGSFTTELWGCRATFDFPVVKLTSYRERWAELEASTNPFAIVVMAHLKTQETRGAPRERKTWKWIITRRMYQQGYSKQDIIQLFRFIDWILWLPEELRKDFWAEYYQFEQEQRMPYITSVEQIGIEKGMNIGIVKGQREELLPGIALGLELKFGSAGLALMPDIEQLADIPLLRAIRDHIRTASTVEELRRLYQSPLASDALVSEPTEEATNDQNHSQRATE